MVIEGQFREVRYRTEYTQGQEAGSPPKRHVCVILNNGRPNVVSLARRPNFSEACRASCCRSLRIFEIHSTLRRTQSQPLFGRWSAYKDDMATTSSMFMYSLTIQPPSAITQAILGQFAGTKEQQIVTASGSRLTIHRPDATQGKVSAIFSQDCFGIIRTLAAFRLAGSTKGMFHLKPFPRHLVILEQPA